MNKLNLGCGNDIMKGYINLDRAELKGVDIVHDLSKFPYPFKDNQIKEIICKGTLTLIDADLIKIMEELYRICKNKAIIKLELAPFPSFTAVQDINVKNFICYNSFEYFKGEGYDYYSTARFKTLKREYVYSRSKKLKWLSFIPNIHKKFYTKFLFNIFPSDGIDFELEVVK